MGERRFIEYDRRQDMLLPPSLEEWLPDKHLARFISDVVDALDLREWEWAYATETGSGARTGDCTPGNRQFTRCQRCAHAFP